MSCEWPAPVARIAAGVVLTALAGCSVLVTNVVTRRSQVALSDFVYRPGALAILVAAGGFEVLAVRPSPETGRTRTRHRGERFDPAVARFAKALRDARRHGAGRNRPTATARRSDRCELTSPPVEPA